MDKKDFSQFIKWLLAAPCSDKSLVFQSFGEGDREKDRSLVRVIKRTPTTDFKSLYLSLEQLNNESAGLFVQINGGEGRGAKHIQAIRAVFLDLDGAPIEPVLEAVERGVIPEPGLIIQSSPNKHHIYWHSLDVTRQHFPLAQKTLAGRFGGDLVVHNLDRVMRVPGSLHWKSGEPFQTRILQCNPDAEPIELETILALANDTTPIQDEQVAKDSLANFYQDQDLLTSSLAMEGYSQKALDVEELPPGNRTQKLVAAAGALVTKYPNESLKFLAGELMKWERERRTKGDTTGPTADAWSREIFPALKRFVEKRDAEIAELKSRDKALQDAYGPTHFAAYAKTRDPEEMSFADFSDRFIYVAVEKLVYDLELPPNQHPWTLEAFKQDMAIYSTDGSQYVTKWAKSKGHRRRVKTVTYLPYPHTTDAQRLRAQRILELPTGETAFNRYAPPNIKPIKTDDSELQRAKIAPLIEHLTWLMETPEKLLIMLDWLAATIQRPDKRLTWTPLIISTYEGVGKGWLAQLIEILVGENNYGFVTQDDLSNNNQYNEFMSGTTAVIFDEVHMPRKTGFANKLKALITEPSLTVNKKFGSRGREKVYSNFMMFSNHVDALAIPPNDRRFFVHTFRKRPKPPEYYTMLFNWLESDGPAYLLQWLLERDLSKFNWGECPKLADPRNDDKYEVIEANRTELDQVLESLLEDREGPFAGIVTCRKLIDDWLMKQERMILNDNLIKQIDAWYRQRARSLGRLKGIGGEYRLFRWGSMDPDMNKYTPALSLKQEALKSIEAVERAGTRFDFHEAVYGEHGEH